MKMKTVRNAAAALALTTVCSAANAVPSLQLGILGGTYDPVTQTIISSGPTFTLYAFAATSGNISAADILGDTYYIAAALVPQTAPPGGNFGSFTFDGTSTAVTADMTYGVPPLETVMGLTGFDNGDLSQHGIYETYYREFSFQFAAADLASFCVGGNNTQTCPALNNLIFGSGLYYAAFTVDVSGLTPGTAIHFDLYNSSIITCRNNPNCVAGDIDVDDFAPFSHDAQSSSSRITSSATPAGASSSSLVALGLGLLGFGFMRRRRQGF